MPRVIVVRATRVVPAPPPIVWSLIADQRLDALWREGVLAMSQDTESTVRPGTRTVEEFTMLGQRMLNEAVIGEVDEGVRFTWRTTFGTDADGERRLDAVPDGRTLVSITTTSRPGTAIERALSPLIGPALRRSLERSLERFEYLVETRTEFRSSSDGTASAR
ncbi:hypothetical protein E6C70_15685 [Glaciibacter flavus]|uniref:SRPBCC family protein n=1 Tax=Orlajensenia flava TaxID=2565934 RepID=A0A4S4FFT8_9MICO|nr:SRPBCC family protein [Glaciibacter flavus]THG29059.1 hypothetical protein E6C70_15685 [Glaciibacter flavus]